MYLKAQKRQGDVENYIQLRVISSYLLDTFHCVCFVTAETTSLQLYFISV